MKTPMVLLSLIVGSMGLFTVNGLRAQTVNSAPAAGTATANGNAPTRVREGPAQIIQEKIRSEMAARLAQAGAKYDDLQVSVAVNRDSATPFKVTYRGLSHFTGSDGTTPAANGSFIMDYIGGGQWQGTLAGTQFTVQAGTRDNIDRPFVNDPQVLGEWQSVDFVSDISDFSPRKQVWQGKLFLKGLTFLEDGSTPQPWWTWTKGYLMHKGDETASKYEIRNIGGISYLFLEWKSGDVTIAGMKPHYYVLTPKAASGAAQ